MKKIILAAVMALTTVSVNAFADATQDEYNNLISIGCKAHGDVMAGNKVCNEFSDVFSVGAVACRNTFTSNGASILTEKYGAFPQAWMPSYGSVKYSSWDSVLSSWYFLLLPSLSQEDADILYYLFLTEPAYSWVRGVFADQGLSVHAPMFAYENLYKSGTVKMPPRVKKFYQAFFAGSAFQIQKLIKEEKGQWKKTRAAIDAAYCKEAVND